MNPFDYIRKNWVELLVATIWLQSVIGALIARDWMLLAIAGFGVLILMAIIVFVLQKRQKQPVGVGEGFKVPRQALILTVGRQKETAMWVISNQKPQWLGLIYTYQSESIANQIIETSGLPLDNCEKELVDPWDIIDARDKVEVLIRWLSRKNIPADQIAIDLTGGTTPMSIGSFVSADSAGIDSQYTRSRYNEINQPLENTQECVLISRHPERVKSIPPTDSINPTE